VNPNQGGSNTNSPPCYNENDKAKITISSTTKTCTNGSLAVLRKSDSSTAGYCISAGIIDNCRIYTSITFQASPRPNTGAGCDTCSDGYTKVDTQFSH
jgi:hypothetical protein